MDGFPKLRSRAEREEWRTAFTEAYDRFERAWPRSVVDEYGAGDPSEFFAVVTESFFERSIALQHEQPALYDRALAILLRGSRIVERARVNAAARCNPSCGPARTPAEDATHDVR